MKITIPFVYEALIVRPRCRKPELALIKDTATVQIKEIQEAPVAFIVTEHDSESESFYWHSRRLWIPTTSFNPFFEKFWHQAEDTMHSRHNVNLHSGKPLLGSHYVVDKSEVSFRKWIDDNRNSMIVLAKKLARQCLLIGGVPHKPIGEPRYVAMTFGLGGDHGGTALMLSTNYNSNIHRKQYFPANQLTDAIAYTTRIAEGRQDTQSLPINPHGTIEVLIPSAVRVKPNPYREK